MDDGGDKRKYLCIKRKHRHATKINDKHNAEMNDDNRELKESLWYYENREKNKHKGKHECYVRYVFLFCS